jgi:hypothetical protein
MPLHRPADLCFWNDCTHIIIWKNGRLLSAFAPSNGCEGPANLPCVNDKIPNMLEEYCDQYRMTITTDSLVYVRLANGNNECGSGHQRFHAGRDEEPALTESLRSDLPFFCSTSGAKSLRLMPPSCSKPSTLEFFTALPLSLADAGVASSVLGPAASCVVDTTLRAFSGPNGLLSVETDALSSYLCVFVEVLQGLCKMARYINQLLGRFSQYDWVRSFLDVRLSGFGRTGWCQ